MHIQIKGDYGSLVDGRCRKGWILHPQSDKIVGDTHYHGETDNEQMYGQASIYSLRESS